MLAALVQGPLLRIIPVGLILLAVQRTVFVDYKVAGVVIEIMMIASAAAGVAGGSERGALFGFVLGIMFDLAKGTPLGSTAIAMTVAGAVAGLLALIAADPQWWLGALFVALGTDGGGADRAARAGLHRRGASVHDRPVRDRAGDGRPPGPCSARS